MTWTTATLSPEQAAAEPFDYTDDNRLELDGGHVVILGTRPDGTPAILIEGEGFAIMGIMGIAGGAE
ncbi:hypothetical protein GALL_243340 [mine drainage metagenome]|uniref:Uncharacterized protein n=1 Tax=mine drainage metagenome TaxID=410659 RepID=A0A1J5RCD0_9ZZZZ